MRKGPAWVVPNITSFDVELREAFGSLEQYLASTAGGTGPTGPAGPAGPPGGTYVHNQGVVASTWVVTHNLGAYPNVTVEDSAGTTVEGEIVHNTVNQLTLTFSAAFSGIAYLS